MNGSRMMTCCRCGKDWNISINARIPKNGYICPHCTSKERFERKECLDGECH